MIRKLLIYSAAIGGAFELNGTEAEGVPGGRKDEPMVDLAKVYPKIPIGLRYASHVNITGNPIYPTNARCFVRQSVADRLERARLYLRQHGANIKVWDAYRPSWAQKVLWDAIRDPRYIGDPKRGGSLHSWGAAVDVTLVNEYGRELEMPSDFDVFTDAAKTLYDGKDPVVRRHVRLLQKAMTAAGFLMLYDEWWHFVARDYREFGPVEIRLDEP